MPVALKTLAAFAGLIAFSAALPAQPQESFPLWTEGPPDLADGFQKPPPGARPWVYWFALNGNLTKEGITADFEAMARVGIGGVLFLSLIHI